MAKKNKGQRWVHVADTDSIKLENGVERRILAFDDNLMAVEFIWEKAGLSIPTHTHPHMQILYIVEGAFEFTVGDDTKVIRAGDTVLVKGNEPHSAVCLEPGKALDMFNPMREDFL